MAGREPLRGPGEGEAVAQPHVQREPVAAAQGDHDGDRAERDRHHDPHHGGKEVSEAGVEEPANEAGCAQDADLAEGEPERDPVGRPDVGRNTGPGRLVAAHMRPSRRVIVDTNTERAMMPPALTPPFRVM